MYKIHLPLFLGRVPRSVFQPHPHNGAGCYIMRDGDSHVRCQVLSPRDLNATDSRIYSTICGLYDAAISITPRAIHIATGGLGSPTSYQTAKILESEQTMLTTNVTLGNASFSLLTGTIAPCTRSNGSFDSPNELTLAERPGLYSYVADGDRRLTTVSTAQLLLPTSMRRTNAVIAAQTLVVMRVKAAALRKSKTTKIRFDALFTELGITSLPTTEHRQATRKRATARSALVEVAKAAVETGLITSFALYPSPNAPLHKNQGIHAFLPIQEGGRRNP